MKRLTKAQEKTKADLIEALAKAKIDVEVQVDLVNERIEGDLNAAIDEYNAKLSELEGFRDELVGEMETYYDERSDNWRDGDAGSNYADWKSNWENLMVDEIDHAEALEAPDMGHADELDGLPTEVET